MLYSVFFSSESPLEDEAWQENLAQRLRNQPNNSFQEVLYQTITPERDLSLSEDALFSWQKPEFY